MKALIFIILIFSGMEASAEDSYSIFLIRHAEKDLTDPNTKNPILLPCGEDRAARLAVIFKGINLHAVYSSDFKRTQGTAKPTAEAKNLPIHSYTPYEVDIVFNELVSKKQDALVVGHSDTTNVLAGKLAGIELEEIDDDEYDRLYQVVLSKGTAKFQLLHQAFQCVN